MFVELELFIEYRAKSGVLMEGNGLLNGVIQTVVSSDDSLRSWFFISLQISLGMASGLLLTSRTERCNDKSCFIYCMALYLFPAPTSTIHCDEISSYINTFKKIYIMQTKCSVRNIYTFVKYNFTFFRTFGICVQDAFDC